MADVGPEPHEVALDTWLDHCVETLRDQVEQLPGTQRGSVITGLDLFARERRPATTWERRRIDVVDEMLGAGQLPSELELLAGHMRWEPTMRSDDGGREVGLAVLTDVLGLDRTQAGVMVVGGGRQYPVHSHAPAEAYLVLHGTGAWRWGGSDTYADVPPGGIVVNRPNDTHSVVANGEGVVALYILWPAEP